jgi:hypothetical protein
VQLFLDAVRAVEDHHHGMRAVAERQPHHALHLPLPELDLEGLGRRQAARTGQFVRRHAHLVQALLPLRVHEHDVLGEVVCRGRPQEATARLGGLAEHERVMGGLLVRAAEALPLVHPRLEAGDAPEHEVQVGGCDAVVRELELGPRRHLPREAETQAQAHETRPQQLPAQHVRYQEFESSTFDLHFRLRVLEIRGVRPHFTLRSNEQLLCHVIGSSGVGLMTPASHGSRGARARDRNPHCQSLDNLNHLSFGHVVAATGCK